MKSSSSSSSYEDIWDGDVMQHFIKQHNVLGNDGNRIKLSYIELTHTK